MTDLSFDVLRRLADGEFHSGPTLALGLGVSRATVWNTVRAIVNAGLDVYKVRGRGYRLAHPISLLDTGAIAAGAGAYSNRWTVEVLSKVDSTNTRLMHRAAEGAASGTVIAAEWQQTGRGRMGRRWQSGPGGALTFSALWRFAVGAAALGGLSLAAGIALIRALKELGTDEARLKWSNDVLWQGRKLAGMLIEMQGDALGPSAVVFGIGVNVRLSEAVASRIDQPSTDLEAVCGRTLDRNVVLGTILAQLASVLDRFEETGFAAMREEWQCYHLHQGQTVALKLPTGRVEEGVALGVADDGALLFQNSGVVRRMHSGEISLRSTLTDRLRGGAKQRDRRNT